MDGSLRGCIAELLGDTPPDGGDGDLRAWLAQRGLGLVAVADPAGFSWPGHFLGRSGSTWAVWFGIPPGVVHGRAGAPPEEVLLLVPHDPQPALAVSSGVGIVETIGLAPAAQAPMVGVESARALAGRGLEGDRYAAGAGTFSGGPPGGRNITLVEAEALVGVLEDPLAARRNLVVRGIRLDGLLGRRFRVGEIECLGQRRCEPCAHLERLTEPGVLRALVHRGGLRADVVTDGEIRVGDVVEPLA